MSKRDKGEDHTRIARSGHSASPSGKLAVERAQGGTALLVIDMISCWDFPDAEKLLNDAAAIAPAIAKLKARAQGAGVPVIYANDNAGRWRSDFRSLFADALERGGAGAKIAQILMPEEQDYFVLKPKQSAFFGTPLELLLQHLDAKRLILTGVSSDQCVLVTAAEAVMRDLKVVVPRDCVASQTSERNELVLKQLESFHNVPTTRSSRLRLT